MKFPGSKLLHHWDLAVQPVSLDEVLRSCQQVGLTGFAEVNFPQAVAMIFYYLGGEVNALYREGSVAYHGTTALDRLRARVASDKGEISVYELPLDLAHLLRGITTAEGTGFDCEASAVVGAAVTPSVMVILIGSGQSARLTTVVTVARLSLVRTNESK